jgi:hypothetical protein
MGLSDLINSAKKALGFLAITSPEDADKAFRELCRFLENGRQEEARAHVAAIVGAGSLSIEPLFRFLISEEGVTRCYEEQDFAKSRNAGFPYRTSLSCSFSPKKISVLEGLAEIVGKLGAPAFAELMEVTRGKWIPQNVGKLRGSASFSPKKHEGILIALQKNAGRLRHELEEILENGNAPAQEAVVFSLRSLPEPETVDLLIRTAIRTRFLDVCHISRLSIAAIGRTNLPAVTRCLAAPDPEIRRKALESLAYIDSPDIGKIFCEYFPRESEEIQQNLVLDYLRQYGYPNAVPFLESLAQGANPEHAKSATEALRYIVRRAASREQPPPG